ncbi:MAG: hypothetical protein LIR50_17760 [Bacillota bacterium]|nr:hypothetical protein [Bacillota bacterium]
MKKLIDILTIIIFLAIGVSYFVYSYPKNIFLRCEGVIIANDTANKVSTEISGEISRKPFKKSIFKGNIKIGDTNYEGVIYYFKKNSSDDIIYSPSKDEYKTLGKAYNKDNLNNLVIEVKDKNQVIVLPAKTYEEGIKLYNQLKSNK